MLSDTVERKFIDTINVDDWEVETDTGWSDIDSINKTIEYEVFSVETAQGKRIKVADDHIFFEPSGNEIFAKDCANSFIRTADGCELVTSVKNLGYSENMFDLSLNDENHRYYTNDILSHNSTTATIFILHYILFHKDKSIAILANRAATARTILGRIKMAFELVPKWLKPGVDEWNKGKVTFENGCVIFADASSASSIRGESISILYIDEAAFLENWEEFYASTFPTISSGKQSKVILVSTANGLNHFYHLWQDSVKGHSNFGNFEVTWRDVPGRDEEWKQEQIANTSEEQFMQEHENNFMGSQGTLINSKGIKRLFDGVIDPISKNESLHIFKEPTKGHTYFMIVDTSHGKQQDYSAITIIDGTPGHSENGYVFSVVATYYNNEVEPIAYPSIINYIGLRYNEAYALIENNDVGVMIVNYLNFENEYPNVITPNIKDNLGIRTTHSVKMVGCLTLRDLVENNKLYIPDVRVIDELATFSKKGKSYEAEQGKHDDLTMTLILFAYLTTTEFFENITENDFIKTMQTEWYNENDMEPLAIMRDDYLDNVEETIW